MELKKLSSEFSSSGIPVSAYFSGNFLFQFFQIKMVQRVPSSKIEKTDFCSAIPAEKGDFSCGKIHQFAAGFDQVLGFAGRAFQVLIEGLYFHAGDVVNMIKKINQESFLY